MTSAVSGFTSLVAALWDQRSALQRLAVALSGHGDLLAAVDDFQLGEVFRVAEVEALAAVLGVPADVTLAELAAVAVPPWDTLLTEHWLALQRLYTEVTARAALAEVPIWQQSLDDFLR